MPDQHLPTPPPPPRPGSSPTLPAEINTATRGQHVVLNRLIMDRLPLALPPNTTDPGRIKLGMAAFSRVFFTFEGVWQELIASVESGEQAADPHDARIRQWLATLRPDGLARTPRFEEDLAQLIARTRPKFGSGPLPEIKTSRPMVDRMQAQLREKPHLLFAYAWVMYMATFSGGRWIRKQLSAAGHKFWTGKKAKDLRGLETEPPGFSFLSFEGEDDGEDIKAEFKRRLAEAEDIFSIMERQEIIEASQDLFNDCADLVYILDRMEWWERAQWWFRFVVLFAFHILLANRGLVAHTCAFVAACAIGYGVDFSNVANTFL